MTSQQIAVCLANYKKAKDENEGTADYFNDIDFLLDEFCYELEKYDDFKKSGAETKFRQAVLGIDK